jgi:hypothetical protein
MLRGSDWAWDKEADMGRGRLVAGIGMRWPGVSGFQGRGANESPFL